MRVTHVGVEVQLRLPEASQPVQRVSRNYCLFKRGGVKDARLQSRVLEALMSHIGLVTPGLIHGKFAPPAERPGKAPEIEFRRRRLNRGEALATNRNGDHKTS
jgi:hypothetical protein